MSGLGSHCRAARGVVKHCRKTSFPLFYRGSLGSDHRESAGLGRGTFCPQIKSFVYRPEEKQWELGALQPKLTAQVLQTIEISEGITDLPKVGQSLIPLANPHKGAVLPTQPPLHPAPGPQPSPEVLPAPDELVTVLRPQGPSF